MIHLLCSRTVFSDIGQLFKILVLSPVDSFFQLRTTFLNSVLLLRCTDFWIFGRLCTDSFSPKDASSNDRNTSANMGLWQLGRTEVIEHL